MSEEISAPRKGERITYEGREVGNVSKVEGDICHVLYDTGITHQFIWRHPDGLNTLHDWPSKPRNSHVHPIFRPIIEGIAPSSRSAPQYTDEELAELEALDSLGDSL